MVIFEIIACLIAAKSNGTELTTANFGVWLTGIGAYPNLMTLESIYNSVATDIFDKMNKNNLNAQISADVDALNSEVILENTDYLEGATSISQHLN